MVSMLWTAIIKMNCNIARENSPSAAYSKYISVYARMCEGGRDGAFVIVIWAQSYYGSKVTSLSILPFSLSVLYWDMPLLICDNVLGTSWEMDNIKAGISVWWQGSTAILCGINSWMCAGGSVSRSLSHSVSPHMLNHRANHPHSPLVRLLAAEYFTPSLPAKCKHFSS